MQFQLTRYEYVKTIEFKTGPLQNVDAIRYFKEEDITGTFTKKEFRYSWDDSMWTNWNTLTQQNLTAIVFRDQPTFYLHVKYTRKGIGTGNILRWYLFYDSSVTPPIPTPTDASIDAWTLRGEGPEYYLDRANHTGAYVDLNVSNVVDGSTIGVYSHRVDTSLGTEFFFKRLDGGSGITVTESSSGIITLVSDASGGSSYENPDPVDETVGGISNGDSFFVGGKTFAETMEAIFYPRSYPVLTAPSSTFTENVAYLQTIGDSISIQFTSTLNRGSINPQYSASSPYRSGDGNAVTYAGPGLNTTIPSYPINPNIQSISHTVTQGVQSWTNYWSYDAGVQPYDSKGDIYNSPLSAGNTSTDSVSLEGVYPLFATTASIDTLTEQPLVSMITGNNIQMTLVAEPPFGTDRQKFDIPNAWLASRPLVSVQFYSEFESAWKFEGGTEATSLSYWTTSSTTHVINGIVDYTRYSYNPEVKQGAVLYRLNFS